jgi:DNA-binding CsgD family transcriptional regulator
VVVVNVTVELLERNHLVGQLTRSARHTARGAGGSIAVVCGEPGIGKSTLVGHLVQQRLTTRTLVGRCDELSEPRALGAFQDVGEQLGLAAGPPEKGAGTSEEYAHLLLQRLGDKEPTVLVAEDLQWAGPAALDVLKVLGRRVGGLPVLIVLTYRPGEPHAGHPLWPALDGLQGSIGLHLEPRPLSRDAVLHLTSRAGRPAVDAERIYRLSRGNPWLVEELVAQPDEELPPAVTAATLGWTARLDEPTRQLLELLCVAPDGLTQAELDVLSPTWVQAAAPAERVGLISSDSTRLTFRYEAVRLGVLASVPLVRRRDLGGRVTRARHELASNVGGRHDATTLSPPPDGSTGDLLADLTGRQLDVLRLLAAGHTNTVIAQRLTISPRTVEHHVSDLLRKLGATTRTEAAARCLQHGIPAADHDDRRTRAG